MRFVNHFDLLAPFYESAIRPKQPEKLLSLVKLPEQGVVLDAGGGTGRIAQFLVKPGVSVVIADLSFGMLRHAQKDGILKTCTNTTRLPFSDESIDRIVMVDAFHHVLPQKETAQELWRVLKPNGIIVIEEPNIKTVPVKLISLIEKLALMDSNIISADRIAELFRLGDARIQIETQDHTVWVSVYKPQPL